MSPPRQIRLLAFDMIAPGHIQQGMWRHPRDRAAAVLDMARWADLARTLERGLFDALFLADVLGTYDVHGGGPEAAVRGGVQIPAGDPLLMVPVMAHATRHLGFGVTVNTAAEPPALLARRFSTLDHMTNGRMGWNVVTGYLDSAARLLGRDGQTAHGDRYEHAEHVLAACRALWEDSWDDDAVRVDRAADIFTDPEHVRAVGYDTGGVRLSGIHLLDPSPQRTPVIFQAGASDRGLAFAARHAECVFVNATSPERVAKTVADVRGRAAALGRTLRVFVGATVVLGRTDAAAAERLAEYRSYESTPSALAHASGSLGVDLAAFDPDAPLTTTSRTGITSNLAAFAGQTPRAFANSLVLGGRQRPIVGSAATVADLMQDWVARADIDGFMLARTVTPECFEAAADLLVPELQRRGVYKTAYAPGTLRDKLAS